MAFSRSRHATTFSAMAKRECVDGTDWGFCLPVSHCHPCCLELLELELSNRVTVFAVLGTNVPWKAMSLELPAVNVLVQQAKSVVGCNTAARTVNVKHSPLHGFFVVPSLDWRSSRMTNNSLKPGVLHVLFFFFFTVSCFVPASVTYIYHAAVSVPGQRIDETLGHLADSDKRTGSQNHSGSCTIKSFPSLRRVSELLKLQVQVSGAHSCHGGQADTKVPLLRSLGSGRA